MAEATQSMPDLKPVKERTKLRRLTTRMKLGKGEAEAVILGDELRASAVLTSDCYAAIKE